MSLEDRDWYREKARDLDKGGFLKRSIWDDLGEFFLLKETKWYEIYRVQFWKEYWKLSTIRWWMMPFNILYVVALVWLVRKTGIMQFLVNGIIRVIMGY